MEEAEEELEVSPVERVVGAVEVAAEEEAVEVVVEAQEAVALHRAVEAVVHRETTQAAGRRQVEGTPLAGQMEPVEEAVGAERSPTSKAGRISGLTGRR